MSTALKKKIQRAIEDADISVLEFERRAGVRQSAVSNILYGRSTNPSSKLLQAIANEIGCTFESLLNPNEKSSGKGKKGSSKTWKVNIMIAKKAMNEMVRLTSEMNIDVTSNSKEFFDCVREVHDYSVSHDKNDIDYKFAQWIVDTRLTDE